MNSNHVNRLHDFSSNYISSINKPTDNQLMHPAPFMTDNHINDLNTNSNRDKLYTDNLQTLSMQQPSSMNMKNYNFSSAMKQNYHRYYQSNHLPHHEHTNNSVCSTCNVYPTKNFYEYNNYDINNYNYTNGTNHNSSTINQHQYQNHKSLTENGNYDLMSNNISNSDFESHNYTLPRNFHHTNPVNYIENQKQYPNNQINKDQFDYMIKNGQNSGIMHPYNHQNQAYKGFKNPALDYQSYYSYLLKHQNVSRQKVYPQNYHSPHSYISNPSSSIPTQTIEQPPYHSTNVPKPTVYSHNPQIKPHKYIDTSIEEHFIQSLTSKPTVNRQRSPSSQSNPKTPKSTKQTNKSEKRKIVCKTVTISNITTHNCPSDSVTDTTVSNITPVSINNTNSADSCTTTISTPSSITSNTNSQPSVPPILYLPRKRTISELMVPVDNNNYNELKHKQQPPPLIPANMTNLVTNKMLNNLHCNESEKEDGSEKSRKSTPFDSDSHLPLKKRMLKHISNDDYQPIYEPISDSECPIFSKCEDDIHNTAPTNSSTNKISQIETVQFLNQSEIQIEANKIGSSDLHKDIKKNDCDKQIDHREIYCYASSDDDIPVSEEDQHNHHIIFPKIFLPAIKTTHIHNDDDDDDDDDLTGDTDYDEENDEDDDVKDEKISRIKCFVKKANHQRLPKPKKNKMNIICVDSDDFNDDNISESTSITERFTESDSALVIDESYSMESPQKWKTKSYEESLCYDQLI